MNPQKRSALLPLTVLLSLLTILLVLIDSPKPVQAKSGYPYTTQGTDIWGFYRLYCTSYAAWAVDDDGTYFHNTMAGPNGNVGRFGDAGNWDNNASYIGIGVSDTPHIGDIAVWDPWKGGSENFGHVAYVEAVNTDGTANISEYNWWPNPFSYGERSNKTATHYINMGQPESHTPLTNSLSSGKWQILPPADVNNDNLDDLIAFNTVTTEVRVTLSTGSSLGSGYRDAQVWNTNTFYGGNWILLDPADVNNDNKADLIAFDTNSRAVDVTLSTGTNFGGGYAGAQVWNSDSKYSTSDWRMLPPKDVNDDNKADLIAFNPDTTAVDVTLSTGTNFGGGFAGYQVWNSNTYYGGSWQIIDVSDINADNRADLIAFNKDSRAVDVTLSTGTDFGGGYAGAQVWNSDTKYSTPDWKMLPPKDVNNDNMADLIAFNPDLTAVDVTLSTGTNFGGGFAGYQVWNNNINMTNGWNPLPSGFMTNDNLADFVVFDTTSSEVKVFESSGASFQEGTNVLWNGYTTYMDSDWINLRPSDVDGDEDDDLIKFDKVTTKVEVILSNRTNFGGGSKGYVPWNSKTFYGAPWVLLDPADVDGDGDADLVAFNTNTTAIDVTLSTKTNFGGGYAGAQIWNPISYYSTSTWDLLRPSDVDTDGDADLIAFNRGTTAVDVSISDGSSFGSPQVWNSSTLYSTANWKMLNPSDVNDDNKADLIAFNPSTTAVDVTLSTGTNFGGGYGNPQVWNSNTFYGGSWKVLNPADVNHDNQADIIAFNTSTTAIDVTLSTGTNFGGGYGGAQVWNPNSYYGTAVWELWPLSDADGNGDADIIAFNRNTTAVDVSLSNSLSFGNPQVWNTNIDR